MSEKTFIWCTYRTWSFEVLEGLLSHPDFKCSAILTTLDCVWDFTQFEARGIRVFRLSPESCFKNGSAFLEFLKNRPPSCSFFYGWSWIIPKDFHEKYFSVTLHPGKLPNDKGGSPLQNQIRNGETWSYVNIIQISEKMDEGDIFVQEKISLLGDISDVWARMTASGIYTTRNFLTSIKLGTLRPKKQIEKGATYKRVKPGSEELKPAEHTALQAFNIIRAHNETDPNTYVKKAFYRLGGHRILCLRADLVRHSSLEALNLEGLGKHSIEILYEHSHQVNNGEKCFKLTFRDQKPIFITQTRVTNL